MEFGNSKPKEKLDEVYILEAQASIESRGSMVIEETGKGSKGKMLPKSLYTMEH